MIHLNPNLTRLRASPTLAINDEIRAARAAGEDVVHFGFGQSPFPVAPAMVEELARHAGDKDYLPAAGLLELREAVGRHYTGLLGREVKSDEVFIGPGSKTNIYHVLYAHAGPLVLPSPSWVSYAPQAQLVGKPGDLLPIRPDLDYKVSPDDLEARLSGYPAGHQALFLLNSPGNPTGVAYEDAELEALAVVCRRHRALVLSDEIYGEVSFDGSYRSIARFYPEGTLVSGGLSKAFAAGGWRLGVLLVPPELDALRGPLSNLATETFSCVASPVQRAAVLAYDGHPEVQTHVRDTTAIHALVNTWVARGLAAGGVRVAEPGGAFYLFPHFGDRARSAGVETSEGLAMRLLRDHRVASLPGSAFLAPPEHLAVRISPVDYDGAVALERFRELGDALHPDAFMREACPRVVDGVGRLLELGEG